MVPGSLLPDRPRRTRPASCGPCCSQGRRARLLMRDEQRYYDPTLGVFLGVDSVNAYSNPVGQFHRYWYASNNPYKFTDPDERIVWFAPIFFGFNALLTINDANAPGPKAVPFSLPVGEQAASAIPAGGRAISGVKWAMRQGISSVSGRRAVRPGDKWAFQQVSKQLAKLMDVRLMELRSADSKPSGQVDEAGRPRLRSEGKIRVDLDPSK